jgi:hypothetical protein
LKIYYRYCRNIFYEIFNNKCERFRRFLKLNRNAKYRIKKVDWENNFTALNGNQGSLHTDFKESKIKRKKEEIPCVMQIKKPLLVI